MPGLRSRTERTAMRRMSRPDQASTGTEVMPVPSATHQACLGSGMPRYSITLPTIAHMPKNTATARRTDSEVTVASSRSRIAAGCGRSTSR